MKKIRAILICLIGIFICAFIVVTVRNTSPSESLVKSIELSTDGDEFCKNEEIEVNVKINSSYPIQAEDFVMFGGAVQIKDANTAILTFPSAGTFHVYATVNGINSNELVFTIISSNAISKKQDESAQQEETEEKNEPKIIQSGKDFSDLMTLYEADESELTSSDDVGANLSDYIGYTFAMQGTVNEGDTTTLYSNSGYAIPLTGLSIERTGPIRVYGYMEDGAFHVKVYSIVE